MEATVAERLHDQAAKAIPTRYMEMARDEIVEAVMEDGAWPRPRRHEFVRVKLTYGEFCDMQDDAGALLAQCLRDKEDGPWEVEKTIERRLKAYLEDKGAELVEQRARDLMEQDDED